MVAYDTKIRLILLPLTGFFSIFGGNETGALMTMTLLGLGFLLGLKHALDADHLAAVTTIVSRQKSISASSRIGLLWGIGHTLTLLLAGVVVLSIDQSIPEQLSHGLEFVVALVLIGIGVNVLRTLLRGGTLHHHLHRHGRFLHAHPHIHSAASGNHETATHSHSTIRRSLSAAGNGTTSILLGMLHGLAGSGALMLLIAATIRDFWEGLLYISVFGVGSVGGMLLMSTLVSIPFVMTSGRFRQANSIIRGLAGAASIAVGVTMGLEIALAEGLFR